LPAAHPLPLIAIIAEKIDERRRLRAALSDRYRVMVFPTSHSAFYAFRLKAPAVILVDEPVLRATRGNVVKTIRLEPASSDVPIIFAIAAEALHLAELQRELGAFGIVEKPIEDDALSWMVSQAVNTGIEASWDALPETPRAALRQTSMLFGRLTSMVKRGEPVEYEALKTACLALIDATDPESVQNLLDGVKGHDDYTYAHSLKVSMMLALFGRRVGLPEDQVMVLTAGGLVHDVGKITVPLAILNKPGRLNAHERTVMNGHVNASVRCLGAHADVPSPVIAIAAQHHEKLDGSGYPEGLAGAQLNELARMSSIIDIFSALTDRRVYKPGMPAEKAFSLMKQEMQAHLDMRLLPVFEHIVLDEGLTF
jgi:HD-GYP domain-containing protein (c-di-GMP phosphodiesterase class II)